jgi:hypothetical protein
MPSLRLMIGSFWAALLVSACGGDECVLGEVRCMGNRPELCVAPEEGADPRWIPTSCEAGFCREPSEPNSAALCAQTEQPVPECGDGQRSLCRGNEAVDCRDGYVVRALDCTTGAVFPASASPQPGVPDGFCMTLLDGAFCALEEVENPLCNGASFAVCDGNELLSCLAGFVYARSSCSGDTTCVAEQPHATCAVPE